MLRRSLRLRWLGLVPAACCLLALNACGGGSSPSPVPSTSASTNAAASATVDSSHADADTAVAGLKRLRSTAAKLGIWVGVSPLIQDEEKTRPGIKEICDEVPDVVFGAV